ncbi:MAG TPA: cytochrome c [Sphingomicrobium sp.]|nr:cytochrome c [Sphingomicrobium sp.]
MAREFLKRLPSVAIILLVLLVLGALGGAFIFAGVYDVGADAPHSSLVTATLQELRERSIANYGRRVSVPADFEDPKRVAAGAGLYGEMCTGCHLGPGLERSELSQGLYPAAPELARGDDLTPSEQFWVIKHGVKFTAMPAWGKTHDDQLIWDMVAFIRQLPKMSPAQYRQAVASAPESHAEMMEHMAGGKSDPAPEQQRR